MEVEELATAAVDCGFHIHQELGPGLLETVYEAVLAHALPDRGLAVLRQVPVPIRYRGLAFVDAFRADLIVENALIIEVKSVERSAPVHAKQLLTYLPDGAASRAAHEFRLRDLSRGRQTGGQWP